MPATVVIVEDDPDKRTIRMHGDGNTSSSAPHTAVRTMHPLCKEFGMDTHVAHHHLDMRRAVGSIVMIGAVVTVMLIGTAAHAAAEEPKASMAAPQAQPEQNTRRPQAPQLLSVEVIPDAPANAARAGQQHGYGAAPPIAVDLRTTTAR